VEAENGAREAERKLEEAKRHFDQGDLDSAEQAANDAADLRDSAAELMDDAADLMSYAADEAQREYQKKLYEKLLQEQKEERQRRAAEARDAALKNQVCLRYISEYYAIQSGDQSLLKEVGGFVSGSAKDAIETAGEYTADSEQLEKFLERAEEQRRKLEKLLSILNGIADNSSMESRNAAFATALEISGEIAQRIPGLGEFFNFYASAFSESVNAIYALEEKFIERYKPMVDHFVDSGRDCCSYSYEELAGKTLTEIVDEKWMQFERTNRTALARLSGETLRKLEAYFKDRLTLKWTRCCLQFTLDGQPG
jgi:hypothetical protein